MTSPGWTTLADVRRRLRRRWDNGQFLTAWATGTAWETIDMPLRGPAPGELADRFDDARAWRQDWVAAQRRSGAFRLTTRTVGGRSIGSNALPARLTIDRWEDLWRVLDVAREVRRFTDLCAATEIEQPRLVQWMTTHPMAVLAHEQNWRTLVSTVGWLEAERDRGRYLRQVPIPGVDTKFIEGNRAVLADLLDWLLPADAVDQSATRAQFARRYGFASQPVYVRFRLLGRVDGPVPGVRELAVRAEEFAAVAPDVDTVYIVENEVTYLAFPDADDAVVIFGSGYALSAIASLPWFLTRRIRYWGDLDTHGFAILNQLRSRLPQVASFLMDRPTLLEHAGQWVREGVPAKAPLPHLSADEAELYRDLVEDALGPSVRLEQERVSFRCVERALGESTAATGQLSS